MNLKGNAIFQEVHLVNTTFQPKPKEASVNDTINHPIVEDSNAFDVNITLLIKDDKEGKKIVASGKIFDEDIVTDTNNITLKQMILRTPIIVTKKSNVSVNNVDDSIVKNLLQDMNTKHKIEREEENKETNDIKTIKQESSSATNKDKEKMIANTFHYKPIEDNLDIVNTKRNKKYVNVNVIDKHIKEIDDLYHNVDNNLDQGVKISSSVKRIKDLKVAVTTEISYSANCFRSIPSITENKGQNSALFLTYNSTDAADFQGLGSPIIHDDEIIDHVVNKRKVKKRRSGMIRIYH